ncbi:anticodon-binding aminoacyl-tRNA synthetase, class 1a [Tanacetum coccineum]
MYLLGKFLIPNVPYHLMNAVDAKKAIQEMADHYQKWHNGTSTRTRSTDTFDGLAAIQAQLNNLGREIKKVNGKVYAARYGVPFPPRGRFRAAALGFYQRDNENPSYQERRQTMEESMNKFMAKSAKKHDKNSILIKEIRSLTDAAIRKPRSLDQRFGNSNRANEQAATKLTVELADRTIKYPKGVAENVLVGIGKFVFPIDFIVLVMPEDVKVPFILGRPFLSTTHAKIDVFEKEITLRVENENVTLKIIKPTSCLIKRVFMLSLKERMKLDLEARLMGEALMINRSQDPIFEDFIELNDLNTPVGLRRNQVEDLGPTVGDGEVIDKPMIDIIKTKNNESFQEYTSFCDFDRKIHIDYAYNLKFSCMIVVENMDGYRDQDMGDVISGEPFCKASCVEARSNYGVIGESFAKAPRPRLPPPPFWSLNEDILKITILKTNTPYPLKKIRRIRACTHQRPQKDKDQYPETLQSSVSADATEENEFPPSSFIPTDAFVHGNAVPAGTASDFFADPSNKGKSPMVEENPPIKERSFRQMEEDRLGAEAARKLFEEEQAELAREQEEMKKKRQEDVINSAKYYNDDDWSDIMGQVHANKGLTADLLGPDVNEDNFAARMAAIIAERRRKFAAQSSAIYSTGWNLKYVKTFTDDQLKAELDKIRNDVADLQAHNLRRSLKRPGADVEQPGSKKSKSSAAPQTPVPAATSAGVTPDTYSNRRKSLAPRKMPSSEVDFHAPDTSFITMLSDDVSDVSDDDTDPLFWHIFAAWEVIPTGLGDVNALYFTDKTSKYFTHLREILHLVDRQDLSKLYGMVVKHYEVHPLAGNGLILWGDLHVLFESTSGGSSVDVWNDQQEWVIHSWKLFPFSGVHVLETFSGKILYMFADTPYPLSVSLMKKMLKHKLEVEVDGVGNDMTYAVQLIQFIKNQLATCVPSA